MPLPHFPGKKCKTYNIKKDSEINFQIEYFTYSNTDRKLSKIIINNCESLADYIEKLFYTENNKKLDIKDYIINNLNKFTVCEMFDDIILSYNLEVRLIVNGKSLMKAQRNKRINKIIK